MKSALHLQLHQPSDNRTVVSGREVTGLRFSRAMARAWSQAVPERQRQQAAWAFIKAAMDEYIEVVSHNAPAPIRTSPPRIAVRFPLDRTVMELARTVGREAAELPIEQAAYQVSATYTVLVPSTVRSQLGMYYTPLALTRRLLDMADEAGIDWKAARVLDPACGGGAFLLPVALRMREALAYLPAAQRFHKITTQLRGLEIDPFAAWLTQTWLEIALADLMNAAREPLPSFVQVCDALDQQPDETLFDLVIGNPPYGRVSLSAQQRQRFKRCLFGHANLYGVFTDIALRWAKPEGVIAYVTPTSFLAGEYFKGLRSLLATEAPPVAIGFINARWGVFEDVLQEALLATYRRGSICNGTPVHYLAITSDHSASVITNAGRFTVPPVPARPWLVPRLPEHQELICRLAAMPHRLKDWGYEVSTGPLVWNRFKDQLRDRPGPDTFPLIWAEAVSATGRFMHRAEKRRHKPYFRTTPKDEWLKVSTPCVLVQRTTAKEQPRRLIAAEMPARFIKKHGAVIVENHLNMIRAAANVRPKVSTAVVSAILNSTIIDEAFRCISGSVAVSAFELESLPLPPPEEMQHLASLIKRRATVETIQQHIRALYIGQG